MKNLLKFLLTFALLVSPFANALKYDLVTQQRNSTDTATLNRIVPSPATDGVFIYDYVPGDRVLKWVALGPNCTITPEFSCAIVNADWNALPGTDGYIENKPDIPTLTSQLVNDSGFVDIGSNNYSLVGAAAESHYHLSTDIQDSTMIGRSVLTASSWWDVKLAIGVPIFTSELTNDSGFLTSAPVASVAGRTGAVTLTTSDISNFNTATDLRVSAGITGKANIDSPAFTGTVSGITKSMVGLGNADDTSDLNKPISTATQTALNGKFNNPTGTASQVILGNGSYAPLPVPQVIQHARVQTDASGNYTWTYPTPYPAGVVPVITAISESSSSTVPQGVQIVGVPTNTSATFKVINLPSTSVLSIVVLGAPTGSQAYIHLTAVAP